LIHRESNASLFEEIMHEKVAEKFAELFAACAVKGETAELQKEAAAHNLVKSAEGNPFVATVQNVLSNPYVYVPAATAAAGGALGYGTSKKKDKMRNALHYAMMGGLTGLGGVAAAKNMPIFGGGDAAPAPAAGKPAPAAKDGPSEPAPQELMDTLAKKTSIGQPGTKTIPVGAGIAFGAAGGGASDAAARSWFRRAGAKGELNHVPHAGGTVAHYTDPTNSQRLSTALNEIFDDDTDPLKIRRPLQGPLRNPADPLSAIEAVAGGKPQPTSLGLGPVSDADRMRLTTDVEQMLKARSLGPMDDAARRAQNSVLFQELSRRAPNGHAPDAMELLNKHHAGRKMSPLYRIISALLPAVGTGVSANRAADAWQNSRANIPAQEQPK
jgi:hypothetical protein